MCGGGCDTLDPHILASLSVLFSPSVLFIFHVGVQSMKFFDYQDYVSGYSRGS